PLLVSLTVTTGLVSAKLFISRLTSLCTFPLPHCHTDASADSNHLNDAPLTKSLPTQQVLNLKQGSSTQGGCTDLLLPADELVLPCSAWPCRLQSCKENWWCS
uniref:Uncharacterized protein n=1 Tax=Neolamprologus brichardi TaxID=32507 RepID=A0A3Q4HWD7_NEOBR